MSDKTNNKKRKFNLEHINILFFFLFFIIAAQYQSIMGLMRLWVESDTYSHGLFLLPVCIYLFYKRVSKLSLVAEKSGAFYVYVLLTLTSMLWAYAVFADIRTIQYSMTYFSVFLVLRFFVAKGFFYVFFPISIIILAIPVWNYLPIYLQLITAYVVSFLIDIIGIDVFRENIYLYLPAGNFVVAESCSGIRQLLVALSIASFMVLMVRKLSISIFLAVYFFAFLTALLTNVIRVFVVVLVGQQTAMQSQLVYDHAWLGWLIFFIGIAIYSQIFMRLIKKIRQDSGLGHVLWDADKNDILLKKLSATEMVLVLAAIIISPSALLILKLV